MQKDLVESTVSRRRGWTRQLWVTTIKARWRSISHKKVSSSLSSQQFWCRYLNYFNIFVVSLSDYAKGFGGKYGVEKEKMDKTAVGYEYKGETEKHRSQTGDLNVKLLLFLTLWWSVILHTFCVSRSDYSKGFGGKFGVEKEKVDKSALGFDYKGEPEKHQSQKGDLIPKLSIIWNIKWLILELIKCWLFCV